MLSFLAEINMFTDFFNHINQNGFWLNYAKQHKYYSWSFLFVDKSMFLILWLAENHPTQLLLSCSFTTKMSAEALIHYISFYIYLDWNNSYSITFLPFIFKYLFPAHITTRLMDDKWCSLGGDAVIYSCDAASSTLHYKAGRKQKHLTQLYNRPHTNTPVGPHTCSNHWLLGIDGLINGLNLVHLRREYWFTLSCRQRAKSPRTAKALQSRRHLRFY